MKDRDTDVETYSAKEYFDMLKGKKRKVTDDDLRVIYDNCSILVEKYQITGQVDALRVVSRFY
jgi:hypothetical protein